MKEKTEEALDYPLWIDPVNRILSFHYAEGFEILHFHSLEAHLAFAREKCASGYRIQ